MRSLSFLLCLAVMTPMTAKAWNARVHVYTANLIREDIMDDGTMDLGPYGAIPLRAEIRQAIASSPRQFRAGAIGPDGFPDILVGQGFAHVDQSEGFVQYIIDNRQLTCREAVSFGYCGRCDVETCLEPRDNEVPYYYQTSTGAMATRPRHFWRSIDWARRLVEAAWENKDPNPEKRAANLAFAMGYLMHVAGDAFGHAWVNLYAEGAWDLLDGRQKPEFRHVALERYVEYLFAQQRAGTDPAWDDVAIDVPVDFIREYLMREMVSEDDSAAAPALHIRFLYGYEKLLRETQSRLNLPSSDEFSSVDPPVYLDPKNPVSFSSVWSYLANRCVFETAFSGFAGQGGSCMAKLYTFALSSYIDGRLKAVRNALNGWITLSLQIQQDILAGNLDPSAISKRYEDYYKYSVEPLVIPGPAEPIRTYFALGCDDVGPESMAAVCREVMRKAREVFDTEQDEVENAVREKFASYLEALEQAVCVLRKVAAYYTQPEIMMNWVFCPGTTQCARSADRKAQVKMDVAFLGGALEDFPPFRNTLDLARLALIDRNGLQMVADAANGLGLSAPLIDLRHEPFLDPSGPYSDILWESVASLDGTQPIHEEDLWNPERLVYEQLRKTPVFALLTTDAPRERIHWPLFETEEQDPDGDQIVLAYDLCPCWPQTLAENALDADGDRVGDACDPDAVFRLAHKRIAGIPDTEFGSTLLKETLLKTLSGRVKQSCVSGSGAALTREFALMRRQLASLVLQGQLKPRAQQTINGEIDLIAERVNAGALSCADTQLPAMITSCP